MLNTYKVPEANLPQLKARLAKLAKRCARIKVQAPVLTVGEFEERRWTDPVTELDRITRIYTVTLDAPEKPCIEGFTFVGTIAPVTDEAGSLLGNVLRMVPGNEAPQAYRNATNRCDHCNTYRNRLETFLIQAADGSYKQIGRNCLANYISLGNPHAMAELAQVLIDAADLCTMAEDEDGGFGGGTHHVERVALDDVLAIAASAIRLYGWRSNAVAREYNTTSTSMRVSDWVFGGPKERETFEHKLVVVEADTKLAEETMEWLGTLGEPENDYLYNLSLLAKAVSVTNKNFGIACSAINAYSRAKEREIRRNKAKESDINSQYIAQPGERLDFEALVVYSTIFESDWGKTNFYKMKQGDNVVVYFASTPMGWDQGETVKFKATVKKHELREGIKQTVVTRAKLPKYEMTKAEKKGVRLLDRARKSLGLTGGNEDLAAMNILYDLAARIKDGQFALKEAA